MKFKLITLLVFSSMVGFAQQGLPVVRANLTGAKIYEADQPVKPWKINPKITPDVYTTSKLLTAKKIVFKTDIDSLTFKIKPGEKKNFIVLLNGKDTCYTRIESPELKNFSKNKPEIHDSIPLVINSYNTIYVKAVLNQVDSLNLNFDTGTTELNITEEVLKDKVKSKLTYYDTDYKVKIGAKDYKSSVFPTKLSGQETDGRFGWDLFDGMVVELNYDRNLMAVHSKMPKYVLKDDRFTKLKIKYFSSVFMVESTMMQSGTDKKEWFLFDTGYQRTAMLDNDLLKANAFPTEKMELIKKVMMYGASGNEIPVITSNLQTLKIGKYDLKNIPVQVLANNKPFKGANIHILGNEVLKRFNVVLDFQKNVVYLRPNHFYNDKYADGKSGGV